MSETMSEPEIIHEPAIACAWCGNRYPKDDLDQDHVCSGCQEEQQYHMRRFEADRDRGTGQDCMDVIWDILMTRV